MRRRIDNFSRHPRGVLWVLLSLALVAGSGPDFLLLSAGQEPPAQRPSSSSSLPPQPPRLGDGPLSAASFLSEPWPEVLEPHGELPAPPETARQWIEQGQVTFEFYDPQRFRRTYQGETRFDANYWTDSKIRWRLVRYPDRPAQLVIRPDLRKIELTVRHRVLLPISLAGDDFFSHPLVHHELDHVRISSDRRFLEWFRRTLREELAVIRLEPGEETDYTRLAEQTVKERSAAIFQRWMELIRIRYAELDRQTLHGMQPLVEGAIEKLASP